MAIYLAFVQEPGKVKLQRMFLNMNSYKLSFIIFLTTVVSQVVGDSGEYAKKNAYMLFIISLKIYMVAEECH